MTEPLRVGVLGATGLAGQQVLAALEGHPWFTVTAVGASQASAGKTLSDALREPSGASRWFAEGQPDASLLSLRSRAARVSFGAKGCLRLCGPIHDA